jgi:hypothetical protein
MDQVIQVLGALLILTAFAAVQFERMQPSSRLYLALNLAGSAILAVLAFTSSQWASSCSRASGRSSPAGGSWSHCGHSRQTPETASCPEFSLL